MYAQVQIMTSLFKCQCLNVNPYEIMKHLIFIFCLCLTSTFGLRPSPGCDKPQPSSPGEGEHEMIYFMYEDRQLGEVERDYIIQVPRGKVGFSIVAQKIINCQFIHISQ